MVNALVNCFDRERGFGYCDGVKMEWYIAGEEELSIFIKRRIRVRDVLSVVW